MFVVRKANDRGHANHGWLDTYHTFSFADYMDADHMNFRVLRVINEDFISAGAGFPPHGHRDMEIITFVIDGALEHKDSMGNTTVIRPGEVQRMSAGTGVQHSEFNHFRDRLTHILQIWILPKKVRIPPGYEQKMFPQITSTEAGLTLLASGDGRQGSVSMNQEVDLYHGRLGQSPLDFAVKSDRHVWIQQVKGSMFVNDMKLTAGDGLAVSEEPTLKLVNSGGAEFLLFDLP